MNSAWAFVPASVFMEPDEMSIVKSKYLQAIDNAATPGLKKQLEIQFEWFNDPRQAQGE
jgi:hypothetical protein